jgi:hypothetical protein
MKIEETNIHINENEYFIKFRIYNFEYEDSENQHREPYQEMPGHSLKRVVKRIIDDDVFLYTIRDDIRAFVLGTFDDGDWDDRDFDVVDVKLIFYCKEDDFNTYLNGNWEGRDFMIEKYGEFFLSEDYDEIGYCHLHGLVDQFDCGLHNETVH